MSVEICALYVLIFCLTSARESSRRRAACPAGSPIWAVKSPMMKWTSCPARSKILSSISDIACPRWSSAPVGSTPNFTLSFLFFASSFRNSSSVIISLHLGRKSDNKSFTGGLLLRLVNSENQEVSIFYTIAGLGEKGKSADDWGILQGRKVEFPESSPHGIPKIEQSQQKHDWSNYGYQP